MLTESFEAVRGIDHIIVLAPDLDRADTLWRALGFGTTARGHHSNGGTANHLIMLDRTYIELLGPAQTGADWSYRSVAERSSRPWGVALRGSAGETASFWQARGLAAEGPVLLGRPVEIEGHGELARFALTTLPASRQLPFKVFCCEHLTPQFVWHPGQPHHTNGACSLSEVFIVDPDGATRIEFERITGRKAEKAADGHGIELGECTLRFLSRGATDRLPGAGTAQSLPDTPSLVGISLTTCDMRSALAFAQASGHEAWQTDDDGIIVRVPEANAFIEWKPQR